MPTKTPLKTRQDAATELSISLRALDNLLSAKAIDHIRIGRSVRFTDAGIEKFKASRTVEAAA